MKWNSGRGKELEVPEKVGNFKAVIGTVEHENSFVNKQIEDADRRDVRPDNSRCDAGYNPSRFQDLWEGIALVRFFDFVFRKWPIWNCQVPMQEPQRVVNWTTPGIIIR